MLPTTIPGVPVRPRFFRSAAVRTAVLIATVLTAAAPRFTPSAAAAPGDTTVLDDFNSLSGWSTKASDGSSAWVLQDAGRRGKGLRLLFELQPGGGFVIVRKEFELPLPENYAFTFDLRGEAVDSDFEFKLVDGSGDNVWWWQQRKFSFPREWQRVTVRARRFAFAWGPAGGGAPGDVGAIEFAITGTEGGSGSIWIDNLNIEEREPPDVDGTLPEAQASSSTAPHAPAYVLDLDPATAWKSEAEPTTQWLQLDFRKNREFGGLVVDWDPEDYATAYQVEVSGDGALWTTAYTVTTGGGGRDYVYMPDAEWRFVRLLLRRSSRGEGYAIRSVEVKPFEFSSSPNQFFSAIARDAPPGSYPRYLLGEQSYWTVVGVNGDAKEALLNEDGMIEVDQEEFSIEPFLFVDGELVTWHDVRRSVSLEDGYLPIPTVVWKHEDLVLRVTAFADGVPNSSALWARYALENNSRSRKTVDLFLALRPFQVNPPWQTLNTSGGVAHIRNVWFDGRTAWVNGDKAVLSLTPPDGFGAAAFAQGSVTDFLRRGELPPETNVSDPFAFCSAALRYRLTLVPRARKEVAVVVPFQDPHTSRVLPAASAEQAAALAQTRQQEAHDEWERLLGRVDIGLPPAAGDVERALKTAVAHVLINRDAAAVQPGSRNYARSWIRDGALTSAALLETGFPEVARDFLAWFARYQQPRGDVPCCVDYRGADPVAEHDSEGQFIFAVAEYYRYTRDIGFLHDMWPFVVRAADYMASLRLRRMTDAYRTAEQRAYFGILPESISHEGYSAHPVHSYWDDFFAARGFADAALLAQVVGDSERAASFATLRDDFRATLRQSIELTMTKHGIDYVPGSVELGDLDPSSTAIAFILSETEGIADAALRRTFDRYLEEFDRRLSGDNGGEAYSAYEARNITALVRLGERQRAAEVVDFLLHDRRPRGWNQWPEISWREYRSPRFIGDLPHSWVGSTYVRAVRGMLAYERESDHALVLAAGVPAAWISAEPGIVVKRLPTHHGILNFSLHRGAGDTLQFRVAGDLTMPPGKIVLQPPLSGPITSVRVNGEDVFTFDADSVRLETFPADVEITCGSAPQGERPVSSETR